MLGKVSYFICFDHVSCKQNHANNNNKITGIAESKIVVTEMFTRGIGNNILTLTQGLLRSWYWPELMSLNDL